MTETSSSVPRIARPIAAAAAATWLVQCSVNVLAGRWVLALMGGSALVASLLAGWSSERKALSDRAAIRVLAGATLSAIAGISIVTGGITSPAAVFIGLVVIVTGVIDEEWERRIWLGITSLAVVVVVVVGPYVEPLYDRTPTRLSALAAGLGLTLLLYVVAGQWRRVNRERIAQLSESNALIARQSEELAAARDEALEASASKSRYVAMTSHELRGPLNGIVGMATALRTTELRGVQKELADALTTSADALAKLLNDLLDVAKIESGHVDIVELPFEPRELLGDVVDQFASVASQKGVELVQYTEPEIPQFVPGDQGRLRQVLVNLVGNAVKFTNRGSVTLRLRAIDKYAVYEVIDTGRGLSASEQKTLFSPFEQVSGDLVQRRAGTGLGLWIARQMAEAMGGQVELDSTIGVGSSFRVLLPLARGPSLVAEPIPRMAVVPSILVITPSAMVAKAYRCIAGDVGASADAVTDIRAALGSSIARPDVVLVAQELSAMDAGRLREHFSDSTIAIAALPDALSNAEIVAKQIDALVMLAPLRASRLAHLLSRAFGVNEPSKSATVDVLLTGRLLVVDDDPVNRKVASFAARSLGLIVDDVESGEDALVFLARETVDVALLDLHLDGISGIDTAARILREVPASRRPTLIGYTGTVNEADRRACLEVGMIEVLGKPFDRRVFAAVLSRAMRLRRGKQTRLGTLSDVPVVDRVAYLAWRDVGKTGLDQVRPKFEGLLERVRAALDAEERDALRVEAGELLKYAAELGAAQLALTVKRLEMASSADAMDEVRRLHENVVTYARLTLEAVSELESSEGSTR